MALQLSNGTIIVVVILGTFMVIAVGVELLELYIFHVYDLPRLDAAKKARIAKEHAKAREQKQLRSINPLFHDKLEEANLGKDSSLSEADPATEEKTIDRII